MEEGAQIPPDVAAQLAARAQALARKEASLTAALATVQVHYAILGSRALVILTAMGAGAAFGWAVYSANGWSLAAACLYTGLVFLPALYLDHAYRN